jgi:hypothetical protein
MKNYSEFLKLILTSLNLYTFNSQDFNIGKPAMIQNCQTNQES